MLKLKRVIKQLIVILTVFLVTVQGNIEVVLANSFKPTPNPESSVLETGNLFQSPPCGRVVVLVESLFISWSGVDKESSPHAEWRLKVEVNGQKKEFSKDVKDNQFELLGWGFPVDLVGPASTISIRSYGHEDDNSLYNPDDDLPEDGKIHNSFDNWGIGAKGGLHAVDVDEDFNYTISYRVECSVEYNLIAQHSGKCLDVAEASTANRAVVWQYDCLGPQQANQLWNLWPLGNGFYRIVAKHSGKCLDVKEKSTATGAVVQQTECNDAQQANQLWSLQPVGGDYYQIVVKHSNKCMDVDISRALTANGAIAQQWDCLGAQQANQLWTLKVP